MTAIDRQIAALKQQLANAYIQRDQADEQIKAIRNVMAGLTAAQQLIAAEAAPGAPPDPIPQ